MEMDIRWVQRFQNYRRALKQLIEAVNLTSHAYNEAVANEIIDNLKKLEAIRGFNYDEFSRTPYVADASLRNLQVAIEALIDTAIIQKYFAH